MVSGPLGLVYLTASPERLTLEQIAAAHPRLVSELAEHPGIGFVLVRSEAQGPLVIGAGGRRRLADDSVEGEDPLAAFGPTAADHLRRHDSFPHCPDLLVNSAYDPDKDEVGPFEEFMGSHGGLGGPQMNPVAVVPTSWSEPSAPIVGDEAMHRMLLAWLAESGLRMKGADHGAGAPTSTGVSSMRDNLLLLHRTTRHCLKLDGSAAVGAPARPIGNRRPASACGSQFRFVRNPSVYSAAKITLAVGHQQKRRAALRGLLLRPRLRGRPRQRRRCSQGAERPPTWGHEHWRGDGQGKAARVCSAVERGAG